MTFLSVAEPEVDPDQIPENQETDSKILGSPEDQFQYLGIENGRVQDRA